MTLLYTSNTFSPSMVLADTKGGQTKVADKEQGLGPFGPGSSAQLGPPAADADVAPPSQCALGPAGERGLDLALGGGRVPVAPRLSPRLSWARRGWR